MAARSSAHEKAARVMDLTFRGDVRLEGVSTPPTCTPGTRPKRHSVPVSVGSPAWPVKRRAKCPPHACHQSLPRPFQHEGWV